MSEAHRSGVEHTQDPGGRAALRLCDGASSVLIALVGAQVLQWRTAVGDVLWTATAAEYTPSKPVRGGVPLVFPWFGDHPADKKLPAHGFARSLTWRVVSAGPPATATLETGDDAATLALWPHAFRLRLRVHLDGALRLDLTVANSGRAPFSCETALHTYFAVGDVHTASVHGLQGVPCTEHAAAPEEAWDRQQPLRFRAETDRIFQGVPDTIELRAPALHRTVSLTANNARSAIVWNPWPAKAARLLQMAGDDWRRFVCIETANVREHRLHLAPGEQHTMGLSLRRS